jgi:hypothetical protein
MKKTQPAPQQKLRRLILSRETIKVLNDPALLGMARGGRTVEGACTIPSTTQESTSWDTRQTNC